jgi:hypothetical protein
MSVPVNSVYVWVNLCYIFFLLSNNPVKKGINWSAIRPCSSIVGCPPQPWVCIGGKLNTSTGSLPGCAALTIPCTYSRQAKSITPFSPDTIGLLNKAICVFG